MWQDHTTKKRQIQLGGKELQSKINSNAMTDRVQEGVQAPRVLTLSARYKTRTGAIFSLNNYIKVYVNAMFGNYLTHKDMVLYFTSCPEWLENIAQVGEKLPQDLCISAGSRAVLPVSVQEAPQTCSQ